MRPALLTEGFVKQVLHEYGSCTRAGRLNDEESAHSADHLGQFAAVVPLDVKKSASKPGNCPGLDRPAASADGMTAVLG